MNSDTARKAADWKRVEELYHEALSKPAAERTRFLESACHGDAELRREVESLLASLEKHGARLDVPALEVAARVLAESQTSSMPAPRQHFSCNPDLPERLRIGEVFKAGAVLTVMRKIFHHAPWWMYVLAAIFSADCLLRVYCRTLGPEEWGFVPRTQGSRQLTVLASPGPDLVRPGIKPGDVLISIDGMVLRNPEDSRVIQANSEVGREYALEIERNGRRQYFTIKVERSRIFRSWGDTTNAIWQIDGLLLLATALLIAFARPFDLLARAGALALATLSVGLYLINPPPGYAAIWRNLPRGLGDLLWIPNICVYVAGPIVLTFFVLFPRPLFRTRWLWAMLWLPALCFVPLHSHDTFLLVYRPLQAYGSMLPTSIRFIDASLFGLYGLASVAALAVNYYRISDLNERRRLRLLFVGGGAAVVPGALRLLLFRFSFEPGIVSWFMAGAPDLLVAAVFALFPTCFAYSILRHRLLDIRIIIRQGVQYAAARGVLLSVVPLLGTILAADLLVHGDQPLIGILELRGWIYAAVAATALVAHLQRRRLGDAIDQRFFRERYDARQVLRDVVAEAGRARSFTHAAPTIVARIEAALHPEFATIMQRSPDDTAFQSLVSSPSDKAPPPIASESGLISVLRAIGDSLQVLMGESRWLQRQLPDREIDMLRRARIDLIVPITMTLERKEVLLVLGAKRSEEPYTGEDQRLLESIAASLALPFEQEALAARYSSGVFEECPKCGACCDSGSGQCTLDGTALTPMPLSRTLAGRYRLERRRGHGGMGIIYEATDKVLGRRIALKVIREEFINSAAAAQRFARETRAAGAFDHPNIVTVHDYGVEGGTRAFLVMELLNGITLREELKIHKRLDAARTLSIFRQVCSAADAAHRHQLIHRDLKPENIFLCRRADAGDELVKILDFGIAKFLSAGDEAAESQIVTETLAGILVGTVGYMPPEQLLGERPAISWDLWALAVVAYETLTGVLPFSVANREAWRQSVLAGSYAPLHEHLIDPPAPWQDFFARCLATDPARRPPSAIAFFRDLETALG